MSERILKIELIPKSLWGKNLRKHLGQYQWRKLKEKIFEKEGRKCWICGSTEGQLELHEVWWYDHDTGIQSFKAVHHLCKLCHSCKHLGFSLNHSDLKEEDIIAHYCKINDCSESDYEEDYDKKFKLWSFRNTIDWKQDLTGWEVKK